MEISVPKIVGCYLDVGQSLGLPQTSLINFVIFPEAGTNDNTLCFSSEPRKGKRFDWVFSLQYDRIDSVNASREKPVRELVDIISDTVLYETSPPRLTLVEQGTDKEIASIGFYRVLGGRFTYTFSRSELRLEGLKNDDTSLELAMRHLLEFYLKD